LLRELLEALPDQQNVPYAKLRQAHKVMSETVETVNNMLKSIRKVESCASIVVFFNWCDRSEK
jgi:hypothetical protein